MEEKRIIKGCLKRDKHALDTFATTYTKLMYWLINRICARKGLSIELDEKEAIFQEVFVKLFKNDSEELRRFDHRSKLSTWIGIITRSVFSDYMEKERKRIKKIVYTGMKTGEDTHEDDVGQRVARKKKRKTGKVFPSPSEILVKQEQIEAVRDALKILSVEEKQIMDFFYYHEIGIELIAKLQGVSVAAINMRKKRAVNKIKEKLKKVG